MRKLVKSALICAILFNMGVMSFANNINKTDYFTPKNNSYRQLIAYSNVPVDNIFTSPDIEMCILGIDDSMSVAKVINDDFSLEMDLDVNSKKQIRPKTNIIEGYKINTSTKCVEKVMKPHVKKYRFNDEEVVEEVENIDIDRVVDVKDVVKKQKQDKKERIAKAKANREKGGLLAFFKRNKSQTIAMTNEVENMPEIEDVDNPTQKSSSKKSDLIAENQPQRRPGLFNPDDYSYTRKETKTEDVTPKPDKKEQAKLSKENLKLAKPERGSVKVAKEKPVKVAKVEEPRGKYKAKAETVKVNPEKPVKVAKVKEPKPVNLLRLNLKNL